MGYTLDGLLRLEDQAQPVATPLVEPLGKVLGPDDVFEGRFPEQVYSQGQDTHLRALLEALCGEAGMGLVAKVAHYMRYPQEASLAEFSDLDRAYSALYRFRRLRSEVYSTDPDDANGSAAWEDMRRKDRSYQGRLSRFLLAGHVGGTPEGIRLAAEAGCGLEVDVIENWRWVHNQFSDDPVDMDRTGRTALCNEIVLVPRAETTGGDIVLDASEQPVGYYNPISRDPVVITGDLPLDAAARAALPEPKRDELVRRLQPLPYVAENLIEADEPVLELVPELAHNMLALVDRIKPLPALVTVAARARRTATVPATAVASSERFEVLRFVTGTPAVPWPEPDPGDGSFVVTGQEREAIHWQNAVEWPATFPTIEGALAYVGEALQDDDYGTEDFYASGDGTADRPDRMTWGGTPPALAKYASTHSGRFPGKFGNVFAAVFGGLAVQGDLLPADGVAKPETPLRVVASRLATGL